MDTHQAPSVGRIVHFVAAEHGGCMAAIICNVTDVDKENCTLAVFDSQASKSGVWFVPHKEEKSAESWHWPERV